MQRVNRAMRGIVSAGSVPGLKYLLDPDGVVLTDPDGNPLLDGDGT